MATLEQAVKAAHGKETLPQFDNLFEDELRDVAFPPILADVARNVFRERFAVYYSEADGINPAEIAAFRALGRYVLFSGPFSRDAATATLLSLMPPPELVQRWREDPARSFEGWLQGLVDVEQTMRPQSGWTDVHMAHLLQPFLELGFEREDEALHAKLLGPDSPDSPFHCKALLLKTASGLVTESAFGLAFAGKYLKNLPTPEPVLRVHYATACEDKAWGDALRIARELLTERVTSNPEAQRSLVAAKFAEQFPNAWPSAGSMTALEQSTLLATYRAFVDIAPPVLGLVRPQADANFVTVVCSATPAKALPLEADFARSLGVSAERVQNILLEAHQFDNLASRRIACDRLLELRNFEGPEGGSYAALFYRLAGAAGKARDWYVLRALAMHPCNPTDRDALRSAAASALVESIEAKSVDSEQAIQFFEDFRADAQLDLVTPASLRRHYLDRAFAVQDFIRAAIEIRSWITAEATANDTLVKELQTKFLAYLPGALEAGGWSLSDSLRAQLIGVLPTLGEQAAEVRKELFECLLEKGAFPEAIAWSREWISLDDSQRAKLGPHLATRLLALLPPPGENSIPAAQDYATQARTVLDLDSGQQAHLAAATILRLATVSNGPVAAQVAEVTIAKAVGVTETLRHLQLTLPVTQEESAIMRRLEHLMALRTLEGTTIAFVAAVEDLVRAAVALNVAQPLLVVGADPSTAPILAQSLGEALAHGMPPMAPTVDSVTLRAAFLTALQAIPCDVDVFREPAEDVVERAVALECAEPLLQLAADPELGAMLRTRPLRALRAALLPSNVHTTALQKRAALLCALQALQGAAPMLEGDAAVVAKHALAGRFVAPIAVLAREVAFHGALRGTLAVPLNEMLQSGQSLEFAVAVARTCSGVAPPLATPIALLAAARHDLEGLAVTGPRGAGALPRHKRLEVLVGLLPPDSVYRVLVDLFALQNPPGTLPDLEERSDYGARVPAFPALGATPAPAASTTYTPEALPAPPAAGSWATATQRVLEARTKASAKDYPAALAVHAFRYYHSQESYELAYEWLTNTPKDQLLDVDRLAAMCLEQWGFWMEALQRMASTGTRPSLQTVCFPDGQRKAYARLLTIERPAPESPNRFPCEMTECGGLPAMAGSLWIGVNGVQFQSQSIRASERAPEDPLSGLTIPFPTQPSANHILGGGRVARGQSVFLCQDIEHNDVLFLVPQASSVSLQEILCGSRQKFEWAEQRLDNTDWQVDGGRLALAGSIVHNPGPFPIGVYTTQPGCCLTGVIYGEGSVQYNIGMSIDGGELTTLGQTPVDLEEALEKAIPNGLPKNTHTIQFQALERGGRGYILLFSNVRLVPSQQNR